MPEDRALERLQFRTGIDPELLDEGVLEMSVGAESVGLPARAVQRANVPVATRSA